MVEGQFSRQTYINLIQALQSVGRSGVLTISMGRSQKKFFFVRGIPVGYDTNVPEELLEKTILQEALIGKQQIDWISQHLGKDESFADALLKSGLLKPEVLKEHENNRLKHGLSSSFRWKRGKWKFETQLAIEGEAIDPSILPQNHTLSSLWKGVQKHLSTQDIFSLIGPLRKEPKLKAQRSLQALFPDFSQQDLLKEVDSSLQQGIPLEELVTKVSSKWADFTNNGDIFKLIWLFHESGLLGKTENNNALEQTIKNINPSQPREDAPSATGTTSRRERRRRRPRREQQEAKIDTSATIIEEWNKRMGTDFYQYLQISDKSTYKQISVSCRKLIIHWRTIEKQPDLTDEAKKKLKELLEGVRMVHNTLTKPDLREEYDKRKRNGRAPKVELIKGGSQKNLQNAPPPVETPEPLHPGLQMINEGKFKEAIPILDKARMEEGNNPDFYAALGWAHWKAEKNRKKADEYLYLAIQFDRRHINAHTYWSKVNLAVNNSDLAGQLLNNLLKLDPNNAWAKKELASIKSNEESPKKRKRWF